MKKLIVLCTGNRCRSQMAHGYLKEMLKGKVEVFSAGSKPNPKGIHKLSIVIMKEEGIDISSHEPTSIDEYKDVLFDLVLTVCDDAKESCVHFTSGKKHIHKSIPDPDIFFTDKEKELEYFRDIRNQVKVVCEEIAKEF